MVIDLQYEVVSSYIYPTVYISAYNHINVFPFILKDAAPVYYPSPNVSRPASQLTEEEQVKIAQRMGLIQHLPTGNYDGCKKNRE